MSKIVRVQISLTDGDWQWLGTLLEDDLNLLCEIADKLNDRVPTAPSPDKASNPWEKLSRGLNSDD